MSASPDLVAKFEPERSAVHVVLLEAQIGEGDHLEEERVDADERLQIGLEVVLVVLGGPNPGLSRAN